MDLRADHDRPVEELLEQLARWNDTAAPRERPSVVALFREQARLRPEAPAIVDGDRTLSYREVDERANQIGRYLIDRGLTAEAVVGISLPRSAEMVIGVLGVLGAGCAFVPLDPKWPAARQAMVIADAGVVLRLTERSLPERTDSTEPGDEAPDAVAVALEDWRFAGYAGAPVEVAIPGSALAYVMFTSGSTGRPKGAMIRHEAISERLLWQRNEILGFGHDDAALFKAPLSFDISVNEILLPLVSGGRVVIVPTGGERDPHLLLDTIARERVTFVYLVSSMLDVLLELDRDGAALTCLRHVWCGGEMLTPELYERFRTRLDIPMYHGYGPAETTIGVSHVIYRGAAQRLTTSIGRANPNTELYVLDEALRPAPVGVGGELYVGGFLLGRGYVNAPGLTATRFVAHPFRADGSRLYRTGDLARFHPDGSLDFLGRADNQVKVRGMRLELEDVEANLAEHPHVRHTCVTARQHEAGGTYLVGYVVPAAGREDLRAEEVAAWAAGHLVEYMVPAHIVVLPEFPLTPNGKLDRRALPDPPAATEDVPAEWASEEERIVGEAVAAVLRRPAVGADEDFFAIGGDSILAISLLSGLRAAGLSVTATQIFDHPTARELARVARRADTEQADDADVAVGPVTGAPIVQWLGETTDAIAGFTQSLTVTTPAALTAAALDEILTALVRRHDMLRARLVRDKRWGFEIPEPGHAVAHWTTSDAPQPDCLAAALAGLDPDAGVMLRAVWRPAARQLVLAAHHVVIDGVSWRILLDDLATAWSQLSAGDPVAPAGVGTSFRRWTQLLEQAADGAFTADLEYFRRPLPGPDLPLARRALTGTDTVADERTHSVTVAAATTKALLSEVPARFNAGVNDVLLTALGLALARWRRERGHAQTFAYVELEGHGRESRFVTEGSLAGPSIGTNAADREPDLSRTVGWFTTLFPVVLDPGEPDLTDPAALAAALKRVKEDLARVPRAGLSFGALRYLGAAELDPPQPQVLFNYLGRYDAERGDWRTDGDTGLLGERRDPAMRLPRVLELNAIAEPGPGGEPELTTVLSWPDGVLTDRDGETLAEHFRAALTALSRLEGGGHSPSDFALVRLSQADVDAVDSPALLDVLPMTPLQEGLYFHSIFDDDSAHRYVEQQLLTLDGTEGSLAGPSTDTATEIDADRLLAAATRLLAVHPNLAARFVGLPDGRVVSVLDAGLTPEFTTMDLPGGSEEQIRDLAEADRRAGFDLETGPLMRYTLIRTGPARAVLVQTVHHILADGWSVPHMLRALLAEYERPGSAFASHGFPDYLRWLAAQDEHEGDRVWRAELAGLPGPALVAPGHVPSAAFAETAQVIDGPDPRSTEVHAAWALTLGGLLGRSDVVFGSTVSGRDAPVPGIETMVGLFINTIPVRVRWSGGTTAQELRDAVAGHHAAVRAHQHVSLARIGRLAQVSGPLFDTLVVFDVPADPADLPGDLRVTQVVNEGAPHYPLTLVIEGSRANLIYDTAAPLPATPESILRTFVDTLRGLRSRRASATSRNPDASLNANLRPGFVTPPSASSSTLGSGTSLAQLFDDAAQRTPTATAVRFCRIDGTDESLTYAELAAAKDRIAAALRALGVRSGARVALALPRSVEQVVAVLAVVSAGGAYVPLDLAYPDQRLEYLLRDAAPDVVLVAAQERERLARLSPARILVDDEIDALAAQDPGPVAGAPTDPAYVIYTSGSTGAPKGVLVTHANVVSLLTNTAPEMRFGPGDVWTQFHSYSFDFAVWELWGALCHGGELIVPDHALTRSPVDFHRLVCERGVTVLNQTPSAFYQFSAADEEATQRPESLRKIIFGGEALDLDRLRGWVDRHGTHAPELVNMYGITETTVHVTHRVLTAADLAAETASSPIGLPIPGLVTYLLDDRLDPVPPGQVGTVYVAGDQVSLGYLGRPGQTASRFVANPFAADGSRLYYTGDLASRAPDGELVFAGRADDQVQLKGFRIELGEVESAIRAVPGVVDAAVTVSMLGPASDPSVAPTGDHLVAHVVGAVPADLTERLAATLPAHMVPQRVLPIAALPLTVNGKLDRAALSGPTPATSGSAPAGPALATLVEIFAAVLPDTEVDADTDFFVAGGDSIVAISVVNRARAAGLPITPRELFLRKTPRALTEHGTPPPTAAVARPDVAPVPTPIMLRLRELGGSPVQARALPVPTGTSLADVERAAAAVLSTHDALRLLVRTQEVGDLSSTLAGWALTTGDPTTMVVRADGDPETAARDLVGRLDPERGPMIAFAMADNTLVVVAHHLVVDAVTWLILLDDLTAALRREPLPAPTTSYAEYATALTVAAQSPDTLAHLPRWLDTLAADPLLPEVGDQREVTLELPPDLGNQVTREAQAALGLGPTELLCGALRAALTEIHPADLAIDLERHGRVPVEPHHDYARTAGWFTAIAPVRLSAHTDPVAAAREVAERQGDECVHVGYGQLRYLNPQTAPLLAALPRPQVLFNYLGRGTEDSTIPLPDEGPSPYAVEVNTWLDRTTGALHASFRLADGIPDTLPGLWAAALERVAEHARTSERTAPVSALQRGMYFQAELAGPTGHYVAQSYFTFDRSLDAAALETAMAHVIARHPVVGAGFGTDPAGSPVQVLRPGVRVPVRSVELADADAVERFRAEDRNTGFDPGTPPLVRLTRIDRGDHDDLLLSYHLLLWDGWSREIVLRDFFAAYRAVIEGRPLDDTPAEPGFESYTRALTTLDPAPAQRYWAETLADLPEPTLLAGSPDNLALGLVGGLDTASAGAPAYSTQAARRASLLDPQMEETPPPPAGRGGRPSAADPRDPTQDNSRTRLPAKIVLTLGREQSERVRTAARRAGVTLNTILTGALGLFLGERTGRGDVVFGITVSGREATGLDIGDPTEIVGVLLNTVPARVRARPGDEVTDFLDAVQADRVAAMAHEHLGLGEIQRACGHDQLFDTLFVLQNFLDDATFVAMNAEHGITAVDAEDSTHFPFTWVVTPGERLTIKLEYRTELLDAAAATGMVEDYVRLLDGLARSTGLVGALPAAPVRVTRPAQAGAAAQPAMTGVDTDTVVDRFDLAADADPDRVALVAGGAEMTFAQLRDRSRAVAGVLAARGIGRGATVGIAVPRSLDSIVALFAVLRVGAAYVPLELDNPDERIAAIVADARPAVILTVSAVAPRLPGTALTELDAPLPQAEPVVTFAPDDPQRLRHPAYVIYTSGSTGRPKGVVTEHAGLTNMLINHQRRIFAPVLAAHGNRMFRVAHTVSFAFDMSWEELLWLADGHQVHICDEELRRDPAALAGYCREHRIDVINVTPTYANQLIAEGLLDDPGRRPPLVLLGGEAVTATLWQQLADTDGLVGYNLYGPTEYTINTLGVGTFDCADPVVGTPIDNTDCYVLDPWLRPVPDDVAGELYISGVGLARGYLDQPGQTAARFVANPYRPGERMYRTGDLVLRRADGFLAYLGRTDQQVKIRGHRVELGEVEAAFAAHPAVRLVAAVAQPDPQVDGAYRLAAYLGLAGSGTDLATVAGDVGAALPDYLRPTHYALVDAIPLTVNGKADLKALPPVKPLGAQTTGARRAPRTETEEVVRELFAEALDLDAGEVGMASDFTSLGGHSMLAVRLVGLLRGEFGPVVTIRDLFSDGSPERIAKRVDDGR